MAEVKIAPAAPARPARTMDTIQAELDAAKKQHALMFVENETYHRKRNRAMVLRKEIMDAHKAKFPDDPFDEDELPKAAIVGPEDSPVGRPFYDIHYVIADLEAELEKAKKRGGGDA